MSKFILPVPTVCRPLALVDPHRHKAAYIRVLSMIYHAEVAALEGFRLMSNPRVFEPNEILCRASRILVEDEKRHAEELEALVRRLGGGGIVDPPPHTREFWSCWRDGKIFSLPFKSSVASMFCLFSEGLGYAFIALLAQATSDPEVKQALEQNLKEEEPHLRLSVLLLRQAIEQDSRFFADFMVYMGGYSLLARKAIREQRALAGELGFDFDVMVGGCLRFVDDLIDIVFSETKAPAGWQLCGKFVDGLQHHPSLVRLLHLSMFLPEPPLTRKLLYVWGKLGRLLPPSKRRKQLASSDRLLAEVFAV